MTFAGLPLATLLGIGAAFGALTVLLYVLRLRRRPVPVPFTRLWQQVLSEKQSSSLFSRLRKLLSLLLQLLLVTALVLALGDPRAEGHRTDGRTFVVLFDASASMGATDSAPSRLERGREEIAELISSLAAADRMLLVRMGATPTPLTTLTDDGAALQQALESVRTSDTSADLDAALRLALDALRGQPAPEIVLVSDGALSDDAAVDDAAVDDPGVAAADANVAVDAADAAGAESVVAADGGVGSPRALRSPLLDEAAARGVVVSYVPVGERGRNVAITQFAVRRYPLDKSRHEVLLELTNTAEEALEIELSLHGDGEIVDVQRVSLQGGQVTRRLYSDLGGARSELEAQVRLADGSRDDLAVDDHAFATLPERRRARVLLVTEGNAYLEAAVLLDDYLQVTEVLPTDYPPAGEFDVTVFDGVAPSRAARTGAALYLGLPAQPSPDAPLEQGAPLEMFGFDQWDEKTPLLRWMVLPDIQVLAGRALVPQAGDAVLGASVSAAGAARPILVSGRREAGEFVALGFDPRRSDLVLRVAWPLFLLNVIDSFTEDSGGALSAFRTGTVWRVPLDPNAPKLAADATARIKQPDGTVVEASIEGGYAVLFGEQAGFYEVEGTSPPVRFAANLVNAQESRILPRGELVMAASGGPSAESETVLRAAPVSGLHAGTQRQWWVLLLMAAVGLSLFEWVSYHRRWTV